MHSQREVHATLREHLIFNHSFCFIRTIFSDDFYPTMTDRDVPGGQLYRLNRPCRRHGGVWL